MTSGIVWSWIDSHGRANAYESTVSALIESARVANLSRAEIDKERYVDLDTAEQVNRSSHKRRPVVRTVVPKIVLDKDAKSDADCLADDGSHENVCFVDETFHFEARDKPLEAFIVEHGGQLAKHLHKGVTRIVRAFQDEADSRVVTPEDIRAAASAGGFLPIVVVSSSVDATATSAGIAAVDESTTDTSSSKKKRLDSERDVAATTSVAKKSKKIATASSPKSAKKATDVAATTTTGSLEHSVGEFVNWIGNIDDINEALRTFELDLEKVGRLSAAQITKGFSLLSDAVAVLQVKYDRKRLEAISSDFYSAIPHNTGSKRPALIDSMSMVEAKSALLRNLKHMSFASSVHGKSSVTPDRLYAALHTDLAPIVVMTSAEATRDYERIERYVNTTCDASHARVTVESVFSVHRHSERAFEASVAAGDESERELMLFHGTRKTNLMSLFRNGVQVAPPEAPLTGAMFGRAIYASACASKSAQYCRVDAKSARGVLLLLAVRVGSSERRLHADSRVPDSSSFQSVHGIGVTSNEPSTLDECGIEWPGALAPSGLTSGLHDTATSLAFDEFAIYSASHVRIRYAVVVRFHFSDSAGKKGKKATAGKKSSSAKKK